MAWKQIAPPKTVLVTRKFASEFAAMESPPQDRPLSERRLMVYQRQFAAGGFRPVAWAKCFCRATGGTYRVNGKHTSTLLAGLEAIPEFYAVVESYEADTLEDMARLYATFDSRAQLRTASNINRSFAASVPELSTISPMLIDMIVTGLSLDKWGDRYGSVQAPERSELLLDNVDFALWLDELLLHPRSHRGALVRGPVIHAIFATFRKCRKDALTFWSAVRDETGPSPSCPDRKLAKWLSMTAVNNGTGGLAPRSRKATAREFFAKSIHAWNAWRKGGTTDLKFFPDKKPPSPV